MRRWSNLLVYLAGATAFLPSCNQKSFDEKMQSLYRNTVPLIHASELKQLSWKEPFILDTRSAEEYQVSHIRGARLVNYEQFSKKDITGIPVDAVVILYCSVGYRSERIGEKMQQMGYKNVKNLYGGIFDWKNKGNEVINIHNQPTDKVHAYNRFWSQWLYKGIKVYE